VESDQTIGGFMKRILMVMLFGTVVFFPLVCSAAWVIHLKDGRSFTTPEYREEGNQIKFYRYGGLIGIPKDQVISIEEIADVPEKEVSKPPEKPPVPESGQEAATVSEALAGVAGAEGEKSVAQEEENPQLVLMKEKRQILMEKENISQVFEEAKIKNNRKKKDLYWNKLIQIQKKLQQLQNRVAAENKGVLPPWWKQIQ
jgi:hypothetical protein